MLAYKLILSFAVVFLLPGFSFCFMLFPSSKQLDGLERIFIVLASGAAITSLAAVSIVKLDLELCLINIVVGISALSITFLLVAVFQRRRGSYPAKIHIPIEFTRLLPNPLVFTIILVFTGTLSLAGLLIPSRPVTLTEFYISPAWFESTYYQSPDPAGLSSIPVEIHNMEAAATDYWVDAFGDASLIWTSGRITVQNNDTERIPVPALACDGSCPRSITIHLYKHTPDNLCASLKIWRRQLDG